MKNNMCELLVNGRKYDSPIGFTVKEDIKFGAEGIDISFFIFYSFPTFLFDLRE